VGMLLQRDEIRYDFGGALFTLPEDRETLGWVFSQFLYGEITGIQVGHWIHHAPDLDSARFLAVQCAQELAHVDLMCRILALLETPPQPAHRWVRFLATDLMGSRWEEHVCLEMALGEGAVLAVFYALIDTVPEPRIRRLLERAARQEESHVAFGEARTLEAARDPRTRRHLLGLSLLSLAALQRLAAAAGRHEQSQHPVWRQLPAFARHVRAVAELRLLRMGVLEAPLASLPRLRRYQLLGTSLLGRVLTPFQPRRRRLTATYLRDPRLQRSQVALHPPLP
jgi:hypothetical protein